MKRGALIVFCFLFFAFSSNATHIVGGELNYRHLGNNNYEITLTVYRDCYNGIPPFDDPAAVGIFNASNVLLQTLYMTYTGSDTILPTINSPCFVPPTDVCYEVTTYVDFINLPPIPGGYQLVYQRCCRNWTILNIVSPLDVGATFYASIPSSSVTTDNSNPKFNQWPPPFICLGHQFIFDHSATDFDGDSIAYEMCVPFDGASPQAPMPQPPNNPPYPNVIWNDPPYNLSNLLGGVPLSIDPLTGLLTAIPNTIGQFVVGVCAKEYRNGVLLSTTRRDFQLNVVSCPTLVVAAMQYPLIVCGSYAVQFVNQSAGASSYQWFFGDGGTSTQTNPSHIYPDTGTYTVTLVAYNTVNQGCTDTVIGTLSIQLEYDADFSYTLDTCSNQVQFNDSSNSQSGVTSVWNWNFGDNTTSSISDPSHTYSSGGNYTVTFIGTSLKGCKDTIVKNLSLPPLLSTASLANPTLCDSSCDGSATAVAVNGASPYTYLWSNQQTTQTATGLCSGVYSVTVTDANGCTAISGASVGSPPPLSLSLTSTDAYCGGWCIGTATATYNGGTQPYSLLWSDPQQQTTPTATGLCPGTYSVLITDDHGCTITSSVPVDSNNSLPSVSAFADDDTIFFGESTTIHASVYSGYTFSWTPPQTLSSPGSANSTATPPSTITYYITVTDSNGCQNIDSVTIWVVDALCEEPEIFIPNAFTPNDDGHNDLVYVRGNSISQLYFTIYDRWGERVFETRDKSKGWDGTYKGKLSTPAVFVYYLDATCYGNKTFFKKGNITLIR